METHVRPIARLINFFRSLPGVGLKTAQRYAYSVLNMTEEEVKDFADALLDARQNTHFCKTCGGFSEHDECDICRKRSAKTVCVVAEPKDVLSFERLQNYDGVYHVLGGVISPMKGVTPDDLRIKELLARISTEDVQEIIMATNPDVEGDATAYYLAKLIKPFGVKVTRLAQGVSIGSDLEYADEVTLGKALANRTQI